MLTRERVLIGVVFLLMSMGRALAQHEHNTPSGASSQSRHDEQTPRPPDDRSVEHTGNQPESVTDGPSLPDGMSLDDVLEFAANPVPDGFPDPVPDDELGFFTLIEQLEYRIPDEGGADELGWEAQGWIGFDYNRFVWKSEGEAIFDGVSAGESENDFLYSRLITPFWSLQVGAQYANEWEGGEYEDRWSGALALQGVAPGLIEVDTSLYISEEADVTLKFEGEYNLRLTQRLILQPRAELHVAFQDIPDRSLGAGLTDANFDLRLRYEIEREFAPYIGVRYGLLAGETANIAESAGLDTENLFLIFGVRIAF